MKKRELIFGIILIFICFFSINVKAETTFIYGDVDGNGEVNTSDVTALENYLSDKIELNYDAQKRGNVDGDNKITTNDVKIIRAYINGITTIPVKMGDINEDGEVDQIDVFLLQKYTKETVEFTQKQKLIADVNVDNEIDVMDETILQKYNVDEVIVLPVIEGKEIIKSNDNTNDTNNNIQPASNSKEETKDNNEVVKVEDTLAKIPLILGIISVILIIVGGTITTFTLLKKSKQK